MTDMTYSQGPDAQGMFGQFGGRYVSETLMPLILDLEREYTAAMKDQAFLDELAYFQRDYIGLYRVYSGLLLLYKQAIRRSA